MLLRDCQLRDESVYIGEEREWELNLLAKITIVFGYGQEWDVIGPSWASEGIVGGGAPDPEVDRALEMRDLTVERKGGCFAEENGTNALHSQLAFPVQRIHSEQVSNRDAPLISTAVTKQQVLRQCLVTCPKWHRLRLSWPGVAEYAKDEE